MEFSEFLGLVGAFFSGAMMSAIWYIKLDDHSECRKRYAKIALKGTGLPYQTKTLKLLKKERERIAKEIEGKK